MAEEQSRQTENGSYPTSAGNCADGEVPKKINLDDSRKSNSSIPDARKLDNVPDEPNPYLIDSYRERRAREERAKEAQVELTENLTDRPLEKEVLKELSGVLNGEFPEELREKYGGIFGIGVMAEDAWNACKNGDFKSANKCLRKLCDYFGEEMPSDIGYWVDRTVKELVERESKKTETEEELADDEYILLEDGMLAEKEEMSAILDRIAKDYGPVVAALLDHAYDSCVAGKCNTMNSLLYSIEQMYTSNGGVPGDVQELSILYQRTCHFYELEKTFQSISGIGKDPHNLIPEGAVEILLRQVGSKLKTMDFENLSEKVEGLAQNMKEYKYENPASFITDLDSAMQDYYKAMNEWSRQVTERFPLNEKICGRYADIEKRCSRALGKE